MLRTTVVAVVVALALPARAAPADRIIAIAPFSTAGAEDKSAPTKKLITQVEQAIGSLAGTKVVTAAQVSDAITKAKKPQLRVCEGDVTCITEVGKLVGANIVVTGEVGGLGASQVIYLDATDIAAGKQLRSTTLSVGAQDDGGGPMGAAVRLLDPDKYRGTVHLAIDVKGATVFVNGTRLALANNALALPVGTQAVRVTHPEYHDFVKFVDVGYGKTTEVQVAMTQYPITEQDVKAHPRNLDRVVYVDPPVWRRWYVVGPAAVGLAVIAGSLAYWAAHKFPSGECRQVGGANC
jgi:hypothetical protein